MSDAGGKRVGLAFMTRGDRLSIVRRCSGSSNEVSMAVVDANVAQSSVSPMR